VRAPNGDICKLQVNPDDPIRDIKDRVKKQLGIPVDEQRPTFDGKPLKDSTTLDDNGIKHGDTIDLEPMQIHVREPNGKKHTFDVSPNDTIDQIKDQVLDKTGIPKKDQRLTHKGSPLTSPNKTLRDCGIKHKDTLDLQPMEIKVRAPNGDICKLQVNPDDPIRDIKDRVKKQLGIPVDEQRPTFKGEPLLDDTTLDDNGIKHGDIIELELAPPEPKPMVARMIVPPKSPKKKSYLPEDWKKEKDRYGTVTVKTYKTDYSGELDEPFLVEKTSDVTTTFKVERPVRRSQQQQQESSHT
jgi:Tfp pilus assembly protein PilZ